MARWLRNLLVAAILPAFFLSCGARPSPLLVPPEVMVFIGATATKEFYTAPPNISILQGDYATAVNHICPNFFEMEALAVESPEEFSVIDNWLWANFPNDTSSDFFWTSGVHFRKSTLTWATTGEAVNTPYVRFFGPWPWQDGCPLECWEQMPTNSWNRCLAIVKHCNQPRFSPDGCHPLRTEFSYDDCREQKRVICQKML